MKDLVQKAIEGGWKPLIGTLEITSIDKEDRIIVGSWLPYKGIKLGNYQHKKYSLPDLICDPEFMKAIYGDEWLCFKCGEKIISNDEAFNPLLYCGTCNVYTYTYPASLFHAIEALKILHKGGDAVGYLKRVS